jgi:hypothetical protein
VQSAPKKKHITAIVKFLLITLAIALLLVQINLFAEPNCVVDEKLGRVEINSASVQAHISVFGGKTIEIAWQIPDTSFIDRKPIALHIHRVTSARRVPLLDGELKPGEKIWRWDVPKTKGSVNYEVSLATAKPSVLHIEACDQLIHQSSLKLLSTAQITSAGIEPIEKSALAGIGIKLSTQITRNNNDAFIAISWIQEGKSYSRTVMFSEKADTIVWGKGANSEDWRVSVPRQWISPDSLATDEGKIRIVSLFCDFPTPP